MIHHLNCGSVRTIERTYGPASSAHAVNHCLLAETARDGLVLIETGLGLTDIADPSQALGADWVTMAEPVLSAEETALRQVRRLGYDPGDVRHIFLTHLDVDHCGGLPDFPEARIHVLADELSAALAQAPSFRYRPAHWAHGPRWVTYAARSSHEWFGLAAIEPEGVEADIHLVPLPGHTAGHMGIAIRDTGPAGSASSACSASEDRWLLHCGDAYYYHRELDDDGHGHPMLDVVQHGSETDRGDRLHSQQQLRELRQKQSDEITLISAHDPWEFAALQSR